MVSQGGRRPPKHFRDQAHRDQIIEAARDCVIRYGFHAASMAGIAAAARMSVGQIYRYFPSKESIICAIVERIVAQRLQWIMELEGNLHWSTVLAERLVHHAEEHREDNTLMLEVTAEATRNPLVAEIVRGADQQLKERVVERFRKDNPGFSPEQALVRVELVAVLFEGVMFRRFSGQPSEHLVPAELFRAVFAKIMSPEL